MDTFPRRPILLQLDDDSSSFAVISHQVLNAFHGAAPFLEKAACIIPRRIAGCLRDVQRSAFSRGRKAARRL